MSNRFIAISLLLVLSKLCLAQISFTPYLSYPTGSWPQVVSIGDVNNDGLNDVVLLTEFLNDPDNDNKVWVFLQDNNGSLLAPVKYSYPYTYTNINSLSITDINGDNLSDVIFGFNDKIGILFQNSSGTLNTIQECSTGSSKTITGLSTGDLNNDGLVDIVVDYSHESFMIVLYQSVGCTFSPYVFPTPYGLSNQVIIADMNNDFLNDVIIQKGINEGYIHIYTQNSSGTLNDYTSPLQYPNLGASGSSIAVGDLNGDELKDIVQSKPANTPNGEIVLSFQDPVTNILQNTQNISAYEIPQCVKIADLNCDGYNDIVVAHGGWHSLSIFTRSSDHPYMLDTMFYVPYYTHYQPDGLCIGDINNDGKKDAVLVDNLGLVVLINQSSGFGKINKPAKPQGSTVICDLLTSSVYSSYHPNAENMRWQILPAASGKIISSSQYTCEVSWNESWHGRAKILVEATNSCGTSCSDTLFVDIAPMPMLNLGKDTILCSGSFLKISGGPGFNNYSWQDNSHDSVYVAESGGVFSLEASNECRTENDTIVVTMIELPNIELVSDTVLCLGTSAVLDVTLPGSHQYRWQDNSTSPLYTVHSPGTYTVEITDTYLCRNNGSVTVSELSPPVLHWPTDTLICSNNSFTLQAENPESGYLWHDGSTRSYHLVADSGSYAVTVTNACGTAQGSINVDMEDCTSYLDVPSAFSPNGDGVNDVLYAVGVNVDRVRLVIFNRWGQKVFESNNLEEGWDGTLNGRTIDPGVFIYSVTARSTVDGHGLQKQGNITLIR